MIEYKLKASVLVFSMVVTLTGSIITIDDWDQLDLANKIAIIEANTELADEEKTLLVNMLQSNEDTEQLETLIGDKSKQLRLAADATLNPVQKIKLREAAGSFSRSLEKLGRIRNYEKTMKSIRERFQDPNYNPALKESAERSLDKILISYEAEKGELKMALVQGFLAVRAADRGSRILAEQGNLVKAVQPTDLNLLGPLTLILGLLGSLLAGLKLVLDYRKSQIELKLAELKLKQVTS